MNVGTATFILAFVFVFPMAGIAQDGCWDREWSQQDRSRMWGVKFVNDSTGWAVRNLGDLSGASILHTTDGGGSWAVQGVQTHSAYYVDFVDADHGWAGGEHCMLRTTDGGATWMSTDFPTADFYGTSFSDFNNGWAVG